MKTKNQILMMVIILLIANLAFSANISVEKAQTVAVNFAKQIDAKSTEMSLVYTKHNTAYVFSNENAWIMIAADNNANPVLAYSTEGSFRVPSSDSDTTIGNNFWGWIQFYQGQIQYAIENNITASQEISDQWNCLLQTDCFVATPRNDKGTTTVVNPLLTTTWGQGWPYNSMCPIDPAGPGGHVWAGCVATAMAQIMKYHNWPNQGLGSYGYQWSNYPYTGADFGSTTYNWTNMPNSISSVNTDVATITYHAAVSCRSMWGSGETGVGWQNDQEPMTRAWVNYFRMAYSSLEYVKKENYSINDWYNLLNTELLASRPIYYRGNGTGGHAWVCDGVDANNMYHFNWGWDGQYNGYFALNAINPGSYHFNNNQTAIIGIQPNDGSTIDSNTTWVGTQIKSSKVAVADAVNLTVQAGAIVQFAANTKLQIYGQLTAIGNPDNYIKFTAVDTTTGWNGIKWDNQYLNYEVMADNDSSRLIYTQVEYSKSSGLYCNYYGKIIVDNCKVNNNQAWRGAGIYVSGHSIKVSNSSIYNNHATDAGGGLYLNFSDNMPVNICHNDIYNNSAIMGGGIVLLANSNMIFNGNTVRQNWAISGAGGAIGGGSPMIVNNKFVNNTTPSPGGFGCLYLENCNAKIVNNLIANNYSSGIYIKGSPSYILNSTIVNNYHYYTSGIVFDENSDAIVKNSIIYGNQSYNPTYGIQIQIWDNDSDPIFDHCNIQGGLAGFGGPGSGANYDPNNYTNNIDSDPLFVDPSTGTGSGYNGLLADWSLQELSPCINAGDTTDISQYLPVYDLAGNPRIHETIDVGAYEYCLPNQPSDIIGNTNPCEGSIQTYSVTNIAGITYTWIVPNNWTIGSGQGTNLISVTIGSDSGDIYVTPSNDCGDGPSQTIAVTVGLLAGNAGAISGPDNVCKGTNGVTYTVPVIANASTYNWTVPSGVNIVSGGNTNSITVNFGQNAVSGNISVYGSNSCGIGQSSSLFVTVNYVTADAGADQTIPYGTATTLNGSANNGSGNYSWDWQPANLLVNANVQNPTTINLYAVANFTLTVTDLDTDCTDTDNVTIFIDGGPLYVLASANPDVICQGETSQLNAVAGGGSGNYTYNWISSPEGFSSNLPDPVVSPDITTTFTVIIDDGYNTAESSITVTVNYLPNQTSQPIGSDSVDLNYVSTSEYSTQAITNADYYIWVLEPANMGTIAGNSSQIIIVWSGILGECSLSVQAVNTCGEGQISDPLIIQVDNSVGMREIDIRNINIYPNPSNGRFTIISHKTISAVYLYDISGRRLDYPLTPEKGELVEMDWRYLTKGLYFIHVYMGEEIVVRKVIVK